MAEIAQVVDPEGGIVNATYSAPRVIVSYSRKISEGLPQYESAEAFCSVQADVALDGSDTTEAITEAFATAKGAVLKQLNLKSELTDDGIVNEIVTAFNGTVQSSKPAQRKASTPPRSTGSTGAKKTAESLWQELESDPAKWFDNRNDKRNSAAPDFKRAGTGEGLWLTDKDGTDNAEKYGVSIPNGGFKNS